MKSFTLFASILPMVMVAAVSTNLDARDVSLNVDAEAALHVVEDLIKTGEISISGPEDKRSTTSKRSNVPFLNCGYARALRCVGTTAGTLNACLWAAITEGKDIQNDTGCLAAATALAAGLSTDCKDCLGIS